MLEYEKKLLKNRGYTTMPTINETYAKKAAALKPKLLHSRVYPKNIVKVIKNKTAYQGLLAKEEKKADFPIMLKTGESIILDFADHCVGYLNYSLNHEISGRICDSPVKLRFTFGEFPLEITKSPKSYRGELGSGWLQNEERSAVFMPYSTVLERRYSFRYVKIERLDSAPLNVEITELFADCVSAVDISSLEEVNIADKELKKIYDISVKTLKECEQDVYEDGPKRDRRLWIGDLRLQALTDYGVFKNIDLIKRCIWLFAAYRNADGSVSPCVFPDSYPHVDEWVFCDYSLFIVPCLTDYAENTGDLSLPSELYDIALEQIKIISRQFDSKKRAISGTFFIDWCEGLEKDVSALGVYLYVLKKFKQLAVNLNKASDDIDFVELEIANAEKALMSYFKDGLFVSANGQRSWHSQVWAVLSGVMTKEQCAELLKKADSTQMDCTMHTPYMMHYYIEAMFSCGMKDKAMEFIKSYWGEIVRLGFDCCPEIFNPVDHKESPYNAPEINSACHAWSCTPAYWIRKYYFE